ncbi:MAG: hypothetical protein JKP98_15415 [Rhodobacteraceae bacterium]|nr:hypothetical protein [Paracoccaceae bacterium]
MGRTPLCLIATRGTAVRCSAHSAGKRLAGAHPAHRQHRKDWCGRIAMGTLETGRIANGH